MLTSRAVDVVVAGGGIAGASVAAALRGAELEVVVVECSRESRGHFNLIHHATGMKADVYLSADALHRWGLRHRRDFPLGAGKLALAPPEYVILRKLEFWREGRSEKHLRDVRAMLAAGIELDRAFLDAELRARGLETAWRRVSEPA